MYQVHCTMAVIAACVRVSVVCRCIVASGGRRSGADWYHCFWCVAGAAASVCHAQGLLLADWPGHCPFASAAASA